jgi:hypothetical protein
MILYVNGCSHSAAAEAAVIHAWACDDPELWKCGKEPHPANLAVSYGRLVADALDAELICQAQSGGSNARTVRVTQEWVDNNRDLLHDTFMILQWTTWEREEWFYDNDWWQVNASGIDTVPKALEQRYRDYVINVDWKQKTEQAHQQIWDMHIWLKNLGVRHLFFSAHSTFSDIDIENRKNWSGNYIEPYSRNHSYNALLKNNGFEYVTAYGYHFGAEAHRFWGKYVLQYMRTHNLIESNALPTD